MTAARKFILGGLCLFVVAGSLWGCGYHLAGTGASLPDYIHTIAIPNFHNTSLQYRVEQRFTGAVIDEFLRRARRLRVVNTQGDADAILTGTIKRVRFRNAVLDQTGRNRVFEVTIVAGVTLRDVKTNKILFDDPSMDFRGEYELSDDPRSFFNEADPAFDRLARDFARTVVSTLLEGKP